MRTPRTTPALPLALDDTALDQVTGGVVPADEVSASGPGGGPRVDLFDFTDFFAFEPGFRGGVYVAVGETEGDGAAEP